MNVVPGLMVRILTHEGARAGHHTVADALRDLVRHNELAGITITRAIEGYSRHGGRRTTGTIDLGFDLPLIIEVVDRAERIEPQLAAISALVGEGVLTVTDVRLAIT